MYTVASLIKELQALPDKSLPIYVRGKNQGLYANTRVNEIETKEVTNTMDNHDKLVKSYVCLRRDINAVVIE